MGRTLLAWTCISWKWDTDSESEDGQSGLLLCNRLPEPTLLDKTAPHDDQTATCDKPLNPEFSGSESSKLFDYFANKCSESGRLAMKGMADTITHRDILVTFLAMLLWGFSLVGTMASEVKLPPGFNIPWNIASKDSGVGQEFVVTEYRWYRLDIVFKSTRQSVNRHEETERMKKFIVPNRS